MSGDTEREFVVNQEQSKIILPRGASDAALGPYHVDRSKIFVLERLRASTLIDAERITKAIELTRFPAKLAQTADAVGLEPKLVQAADLIGQLGDPMYPKKANALFHEFEETGMNRELGYSSPADLTHNFPTFYRNCVSMHIEDGLKLLNLTVSGRQWIANLNHHLHCAERSAQNMGPQPGECTPDPSFVVKAPRASASIRDLKLRSHAGRPNVRGSQSRFSNDVSVLGQRSLENRLIHQNDSPNVVALHSLAHRV